MLYSYRIPVIFFVLSVVMWLYPANPAQAQYRDIQGRIGTGYILDNGKFGLDFALQHNWILDRYFVVGLESGFFWIQWNRKIGTGILGNAAYDIKADTSVFMIPAMFDAQLRLPNLVDARSDDIIPYLDVGMGWNAAFVRYSQPNYTAVDGTEYNEANIRQFYYGFAWHILVGSMFRIARDSRVHLIAEFGYRNSRPSRDNSEMNLSGLILRAGVKYPLE